MEQTQTMPAMATPTFKRNYEGEFIDFEEIISSIEPVASVHFLEANTNAITLDELRDNCVIPTWANEELTISHQDFINTVHAGANIFFNGETINEPEIRVSHIVRGRVPSALGKKTSELRDDEKTQFYQRLAFAFTIPTIFETINGQRMELCIGGVRNYNDLNLYRNSRGFEKFSLFIGWRVNICSNQVLSGDGVRLNIKVANLHELGKEVIRLFQSFNPAKDLHMMQQLTSVNLSEKQFAQIVGRMRLYQALPNDYQSIPKLLITDSQINNVCRGYFNNPDFGATSNGLSMWDFHNLLTEANKSSYIESYLERGVNATDISMGICDALQGKDNKYSWFLG